jgi:hypothetical protein
MTEHEKAIRANEQARDQRDSHELRDDHRRLLSMDDSASGLPGVQELQTSTATFDAELLPWHF